jgi:hypothetical protein
MPNYTANPTPITPPRVALIDPRTGLIERSWYMFFLSLFNAASNDDAAKGPSTDSLLASYDAALRALAQATETQPQSAFVDQIAELQKQIQALQVTLPQSAFVNQIAELQKQVQALQVAPPMRQFERSRYGSFYDTTTQLAGAINTATEITFNSTDLSRGVYLGSPTSRVYVDTIGIYNFQTSIQLDKTTGGTAEFFLWFRLNGVDVPDSASQIRIQGNNSEIFSSLNYFFDLNAGDYVELIFSVTDLSVELLAVPAAAPHPGIPSIILTVANNIGGIQ